MAKQATVERIFILDGGLAQVEDGSIYSPGINVGQPMTLSCNAYLIQHQGKWLLWDTGTGDDLVEEPEGRIIAPGIRGFVRKTLGSQLNEIGVTPDEISTIAISHAHFDHIGNCRLFRKARWIAQKAEHDAMFGPNPEEFGYPPEFCATMRRNPVELVVDDHDISGDDAVRLIFTPGHTPGHCSLLVRLQECGPVLLSGDVAHNRENFRCRRVPSFNADHAATIASMEKVETLLRTEKATMWVNHDTAQSETLPHAPRWIA
jgi:N-acyl homoserine lactone hydrolase